MARVLCEQCKEPVRPEAAGTYRQVLGWVQARKGGGAHGITLQRATGKYMHRVCFDVWQMRNARQLQLPGLEREE